MIKKGFTLIELLIVMSVISVLVSIAIPSFQGMQNEAKKIKAFSNLKTIKLAVEAYCAKAGQYPAVWGPLGATFENDITLPPYGGTVITTVPTDPLTPANKVRYLRSTNGRYFVLWYYRGTGSDSEVISDAGQVTLANPLTSDDIGTTNGIPPTAEGNWK